MAETLALERHGRVAELRLTRPRLSNPVDEPLLDDLDAAIRALRDDDETSVVLITSPGAAFATSTDSAAPTLAAGARFRDLELLPQPTIACIDGTAEDAGLELALACDIRVGGSGATFSFNGRLGRLPIGGATQRLPRLIGRTRAMDMLLLGHELNAPDAEACGLLNVVTGGPSRDAGMALAETITRRGPIAVRYAKEAITRGLDMSLEQALRYETDLTVILQATYDRAEGVRAFLEKREPNFENR